MSWLALISRPFFTCHDSRWSVAHFSHVMTRAIVCSHSEVTSMTLVLSAIVLPRLDYCNSLPGLPGVSSFKTSKGQGRRCQTYFPEPQICSRHSSASPPSLACCWAGNPVQTLVAVLKNCRWLGRYLFLRLSSSLHPFLAALYFCRHSSAQNTILRHSWLTGFKAPTNSLFRHKVKSSMLCLLRGLNSLQ